MNSVMTVSDAQAVLGPTKRDIFKRNLAFSLIVLCWIVFGIFTGPFIFFFLPITVFLLQRKRLYAEILIGFSVILVLSDNIDAPLEFAKTIKNVYIVLLTLFLLADRTRFRPHSKIISGFLPFLVIAAFTLVESETVFISIQKTLSYIFLFATIPNLTLYVYRENGATAFKRLLYFAVGIIVLGYLLKYVDYELAYSHGGRLRGIFGNPNGLGIYLILVFLLFFVLNRYFPHLFTRWEKIVFYSVVIVTLFLSGSRNAFVSIGLFLLLSRFYNISPLLGLVIVIITGVTAELVSANVTAIILWLGVEEMFRIETLESGSGRYIAWDFAWQDIKQHPIVGKGFAYDEHLMRTNFEYLSRLGHEGGVHNTYLILWLNTGVIGVLAYFWAFIRVFIKASKNTRLAFPVMFAILFCITFEPWLAASLNPFTILFLIIATIMFEPEIANHRVSQSEH